MTGFFQSSPVVQLKLSRNLTRSIKRGHPWVFARALAELPSAPPGSFAVLSDRKGRRLASGFYDPESPIAFRVCSLTEFNPRENRHVGEALFHALEARTRFIGEETDAYRLVNGEGDGIPGVICDLYADTAVLTFDGNAAACFWNARAFSNWLLEVLPVKTVVAKSRGGQPKILAGTLAEEVGIRENGVRFTVDVYNGQKTGFFLDQRDNRQVVRQISSGADVLNLFGYTGGFSVYAGLGGASGVTTVDQSPPAIETAQRNWDLNGLPPDAHAGVTADVFAFIEEARTRGTLWDLVIVDPPSFASAEANVPQATQAYEKLFAGACGLVAPRGLLAASSCSSHIDQAMFLAICENAVSKAGRRARVRWVGGQPADHPFPLASREFRYLKFVLMELMS